MGAFDDLIPDQPRPTGAFSDLIPQQKAGAFDDLIPKPAPPEPAPPEDSLMSRIGQGVAFAMKAVPGGLSVTGKILAARVADALGSDGNLQAALEDPVGSELPVEKQLADLKTIPASIAKGVVGAARGVPALAAAGAASLAVSPFVAFPAIFGAQTYVDTGGDVNQTAKSAAIAAAFPAVGKLLEPVATSLVGSLVKSGVINAGNTAAQKVIETAVHQTGFQVAAHLFDLPEYASLSPEDRVRKFAELTAANTMFAIPDVLNVARGSIPSKTQEMIRRQIEVDGGVPQEPPLPPTSPQFARAKSRPNPEQAEQPAQPETTPPPVVLPAAEPVKDAAPPVAPAPPAVDEVPKTLAPALMVNGQPVMGGKTHDEIMVNATHGLSSGATTPEQLMDIMASHQRDADHVFVTDSGKVLNRAEAGVAYDQMTGQPPGTTKELHSQMIAPEYRPTQVEKPPKPDQSDSRLTAAQPLAVKAGPIAETVGPSVRPQLDAAIEAHRPTLDRLGITVEERPKAETGPGGMAMELSDPTSLKIVFDQSTLDQKAKEGDLTAYLTKAVGEEITHLATKKVLADRFAASGKAKADWLPFVIDQMGQIYAEMTPEQKKQVAKAYGSTKKLPPANMAFEFTRQLVQQFHDGSITEQEIAAVRKNGPLMDFLRDFVTKLKGWINDLKGTKTQPQLLNMVYQMDRLLRPREAGQWDGRDVGLKPVIAFEKNDGSIWIDPNANSHAGGNENLKIPLDEIKRGGFVVGDEFRPSGSSMEPTKPKVSVVDKEKTGEQAAMVSQPTNQPMEEAFGGGQIMSQSEWEEKFGQRLPQRATGIRVGKNGRGIDTKRSDAARARHDRPIVDANQKAWQDYFEGELVAGKPVRNEWLRGWAQSVGERSSDLLRKYGYDTSKKPWTGLTDPSRVLTPVGNEAETKVVTQSALQTEPAESDVVQPALQSAPKVERVKIGRDPHPLNVIERLPATPIEIANGEQPVRVRNEKTGEEQTVMEKDLIPIKAEKKPSLRRARSRVEVAKPQTQFVEPAKDELIGINYQGDSIYWNNESKTHYSISNNRIRTGPDIAGLSESEINRLNELVNAASPKNPAAPDMANHEDDDLAPPVKTFTNHQVSGVNIKVEDRPGQTPESIAADLKASIKAMDDAGISYSIRDVPEKRGGTVTILHMDAMDDAAGRKLADSFEQMRADQHEPDENDQAKPPDQRSILMNSITYNFNMPGSAMEGLSDDVRNRLYSVARSDASARGSALRSTAGFKDDLLEIARNVKVRLHNFMAERYGGKEIRAVIDRIFSAVAGEVGGRVDEVLGGDGGKGLTDIDAKSREALERLNGGWVYRMAHQELKPKIAKSLKSIVQSAQGREAVDHIIELAHKNGVPEQKDPSRKLTPIEKLQLMARPETVAKLDESIKQAVWEAERQAARSVIVREKSLTEEELVDYDARTVNPDELGPDPTREEVEEGLNSQQHSHWRTIRDNLLGYSPVTDKLIQQVVRGDFKGVRKLNPEVKPLDTRIDLNKLAVASGDEVKRVIDNHLANVEQMIKTSGATPEMISRIRGQILSEVTAQIARIRGEVRDRQVAEPVKKGTPLTADQTMQQKVNADLFADPRLTDEAIVRQVADRSTLQRLTPKLSGLIKQVLATPVYEQSQWAEQFADQMVERFLVGVADRATAVKVFKQAFDTKLAEAKTRALAAAQSSLTQKERQVLVKKSTWERLQQAVNAGVFSDARVVEALFKSHGGAIPSEAQMAEMRQWVEREQQLRALTLQAKERSGDDPAKLARERVAQEETTWNARHDLMRRIEARWASLTKPIGFNLKDEPNKLSAFGAQLVGPLRRNRAAFLNEMISANTLAKLSFMPKQVISIFTQFMAHVPTRAIAQAMTNNAGRPLSEFWPEVHSVMSDSYRSAIQGLQEGLSETREVLAGRGKGKNVDHLMSGISAIERINQQAKEYAANGEPGKAAAMQFLGLIKVGYRVAQAMDRLHGVPSEYVEMRNDVIRRLREAGKTRLEAEQSVDQVFDQMKADQYTAMSMAQSLAGEQQLTKTKAQLTADSLRIARRWGMEKFREMGLPVDAMQKEYDYLADTIGWNQRETKGAGGIVGGAIKATGQLGEAAGVPLMIGRFGNAIATGINRALHFTPFYMLSNAGRGQDSAWFHSETDRNQRKVEAALGTAVGTMAIGLVMAGALSVRTKWPKDKEERDLWNAQGKRPGAVDINLGDGSAITLSLSTGPMSLIAPYLAAAGTFKDISNQRAKQQQTLDDQAAKKGLVAQKLPSLGLADMLAASWQAAQQTIMGGRTAAGLVGSITDYGLPNASKILASQVSPLVPGLPELQELSRMAGVNLDSKAAGFWDFMLPLPTSSARAVNMLGDPAGNPDDFQRITQILTGGSSLPQSQQETDTARAYAALVNSGYRPPSINPNKGYQIAGDFRPLTQTELADYTQQRGAELKSRLAQIGPEATMAEAQAAYRQANGIALQSAGVNSVSPNISSPTNAGGGRLPAASRRGFGLGGRPRVGLSRRPTFGRATRANFGSRSTGRQRQQRARVSRFGR